MLKEGLSEKGACDVKERMRSLQTVHQIKRTAALELLRKKCARQAGQSARKPTLPEQVGEEQGKAGGRAVGRNHACGPQ